MTDPKRMNTRASANEYCLLLVKTFFGHLSSVCVLPNMGYHILRWNTLFVLFLAELSVWSSWMRRSCCNNSFNTTASAGPARTNSVWVIPNYVTFKSMGILVGNVNWCSVPGSSVTTRAPCFPLVYLLSLTQMRSIFHISTHPSSLNVSCGHL